MLLSICVGKTALAVVAEEVNLVKNLTSNSLWFRPFKVFLAVWTSLLSIQPLFDAFLAKPTLTFSAENVFFNDVVANDALVFVSRLLIFLMRILGT